MLGHEINNSLTPIKSLAQTLRDMLSKTDAGANAEEIDSSLRVISDRAAALSRFVGTYSQLAKLPPPAPAPVDVNGLISSTLNLPDFRRVIFAPGPALQIEADAGQLSQALINLLRNAIEATAGSGGRIEVRVRRQGAATFIEILDEGTGVANPTNLFVPFFTTKPGGSGIGLTLSRQIVEAHGGSLRLENRTDRSGCIASIELPAE